MTVNTCTADERELLVGFHPGDVAAFRQWRECDDASLAADLYASRADVFDAIAEALS